MKALKLGQSYDFGVGSITFDGWKAWVNLQVVNDPGKDFALVGALLAVFGLLLSLFLRQRRIWVRLDEATGIIELAGLAKNAAPGLTSELDLLAKELTLKESQ
jgi:cytochrome c biogenesis protein